MTKRGHGGGGARLLLLGAALAAATSPGPGRAEAVGGYFEWRGFHLTGAREEEAAAARFRPTLHGKGPDLSWRLTGEFRASDPFLRAPGEGSSEGTLERAYVELRDGRNAWTVGRQAVNWGHGITFNPTDPFRELFLTNYWFERRGVDGVRFLHPLGTSGGFVAASATAEGWDERVTAVRLFRTAPSLDRAVVFVRDEATNFDRIGVDLKGDLRVGYWFEGVRSDGVPEAYHEWVAGLDYTFDVRQGYYVSVQRYYDGSGAGDPAAYAWPGPAGATRRTLADRYTLINTRLTWSERWAIHLDLIRNEADGTRILSPHVQVQAGQETQVHLGANLYRGARGGEFRPDRIHDPLDLAPDRIVFAWVRTHF